jgi:hypothetical protein
MHPRTSQAKIFETPEFVREFDRGDVAVAEFIGTLEFNFELVDIFAGILIIGAGATSYITHLQQLPYEFGIVECHHKFEMSVCIL